ncbi:sulfotransferase [Maritimibacter sp. DP1N21-5]|uniref:sulfotransferase family protein n=1 Tax=Maritimibacter sp. DP1N21-5 TaxID=2836867 RepID=UPI001C47DBB0|nr:sulfotransferase [Maritimibacter sp. DP1N21-5]MBV7408638.1 sulfotransferase [Maritimibacter sp. DP1N21-5]
MTLTDLKLLLARAEAALNEGRFAACRADLEAVFAVDPGSLAGLWLYTHATPYRPDDPVFARLQGFAAQTALAPALRSQLYFMLAKAHGDMGQVQASFDAVITANRLRGATFDDAGTQRLTDAFIARVRATPPLALSPAGSRLIFVLGMPRSGTSLTAQMLGAHPAITNMGERTALGAALALEAPGQQPHLAFLDGLTEERLEQARAAYLANLPTDTIALDKMPENYIFAWAIPMLFPKAQILHLTRDRLATTWSCFKNDFREGHAYSYDWQTLQNHYDRHLALAELGRSRAGDNWHSVRLEDLTRDPRAVLTPVLDRLGLDWDPAIAAPERATGTMPTLSKWQVRQGIDPAIAGGWRDYEPLIRARWPDTP